eukprot:gene24846-biopygen13482
MGIGPLRNQLIASVCRTASWRQLCGVLRVPLANRKCRRLVRWGVPAAAAARRCTKLSVSAGNDPAYGNGRRIERFCKSRNDERNDHVVRGNGAGGSPPCAGNGTGLWFRKMVRSIEVYLHTECMVQKSLHQAPGNNGPCNGLLCDGQRPNVQQNAMGFSKTCIKTTVHATA